LVHQMFFCWEQARLLLRPQFDAQAAISWITKSAVSVLVKDERQAT
jgi:hypothetical protein